MSKLTYFLIILGFTTGQINVSDRDKFERFQESINQFQNFYNIGDTLSSTDKWELNNLIDTCYLIDYQLVDADFDTEYKPQTLKDYSCSFIGKYEYENEVLLITKSYRTEAGDGNPIITVTTISKNGKFIDNLRIDLEGIHDPFLQPTTYFSISKNFVICVNQTEREFEEKDDRLVMTKSDSKIQKYLIDKNGYFKPID